MMTKTAASKKIEENLKQVAALIKECEKLALDNKVDFTFEPPCGSYKSFDGTGNESEEFYETGKPGKPTGWDHSQC